ncbi:MAG: DUF1573 domain-containing protein [Planctomycetia bacterium]
MTVLTILVAAAVNAAAPADDVYCGAHCLYVAAKVFEAFTGDYAAFEKKIEPPQANGYSLANLAAAARTLGLEATPVHTSVDRLAQRRRNGETFACIALLNRAHYVLLFDAEEPLVAISDPPDVSKVPRVVFETQWAGDALLVSREPLLPEERIRLPFALPRFLFEVRWLLLLVVLAVVGGIIAYRYKAATVAASLALAVSTMFVGGCGRTTATPAAVTLSEPTGPLLRIDPEEIDLGPRHISKEPFSLPVKLTNIGDAKLTIAAVGVGCGCLKAAVDRSELIPGESSTLTLKLRQNGTTGLKKSVVVQLSSDDRRRPHQRLTVHWTPIDWIYPTEPIKDLGVIPAGRRHERQIVFAVAPEGTAADWSLSLENARSSRAIALGSIEKRADGFFGVPLTLSSDGAVDEVQEYRVQLKAAANLPNVGPTTVYPSTLVRWSWARTVSASPTRVFVGSVPPGKETEAKVIVAASDGRAIETSLRGGDPKIVRIQTEPSKEAKAVRVATFVVVAPTVPGPFQTEVTVATDHPEASEIVVPVGGYVDANLQ